MMAGWTMLVAVLAVLAIRVSSQLASIAVKPPYDGIQCTRKVCQIDEDTLRFFIIGDFGGVNDTDPTTETQIGVAEVMNESYNQQKVHFVVSIGDNFYPIGVNESNAFRVNDTFADMYTFGIAEVLPWYVIAGNHDHAPMNLSYQFDYNLENRQWVFPGLYFVVHYELTPSKTTVDIIMIDTCVLCAENDTEKYCQYLTEEDREPHWRWLEMELDKSQATYLFVNGHYPLFSTGWHGTTDCLGRRFFNLLDKYGASAYFCGHDHHLEHLVSYKQSEVHYILSGTGCNVDTQNTTLNMTRVKHESKFKYPKNGEDAGWTGRNNTTPGGFVYAELTQDEAKFDYYLGDVVLYTGTLKPRGPSGGPTPPGPPGPPPATSPVSPPTPEPDTTTGTTRKLGNCALVGITLITLIIFICVMLK